MVLFSHVGLMLPAASACTDRGRLKPPIFQGLCDTEGMAHLFRVCALVLCVLLACQPAGAYSLLTHEQLIDLTWKGSIVPLLRGRYPKISDAQLEEARSYAYAGCVIQDVGYYPFGDAFLSDLRITSGAATSLFIFFAMPRMRTSWPLPWGRSPTTWAIISATRRRPTGQWPRIFPSLRRNMDRWLHLAKTNLRT